MKIKILTKDIKIDSDKESYIYSKIESLEKFINNNSEKEPDCKVRVGKNTKKGKNDKIYYTECSISTSSKNYGGRSEAKTLNEAVDFLKDVLSKKIRRYKGKRFYLFINGRRVLKKILKK